MRLMTLLVVCAFGGTLVAAQTARSSSADEAAVRDLVARYVAAREARDPAAIAAVFTEDADQLTTSGEWRRGRDKGVVPGALASSARNTGSRTIEVDAVRFVTPDVAIADGAYTIAGSNRPPMRATLIAVKGPGGWRITAIRNMLPATSAAAR